MKKKLNVKTYILLLSLLFGLVTPIGSVVSATTNTPSINNPSSTKVYYYKDKNNKLTTKVYWYSREKLSAALGLNSGSTIHETTEEYAKNVLKLEHSKREASTPTANPETTPTTTIATTTPTTQTSATTVSSTTTNPETIAITEPVNTSTSNIRNVITKWTDGEGNFLKMNEEGAHPDTDQNDINGYTFKSTFTDTDGNTINLYSRNLPKPASTNPSTSIDTTTTTSSAESTISTATVEATNQPITTEKPTVSIPATTQTTTTIKPETTQTVPITTKSSEPVITKVTPVTTQAPVPTTTAPKPVTTPSTEATTKTITVKQPFTTNGRASVVYYVIDKYRKPSNVYWYFEENLRKFMDAGSGSTVHTMTEAQALALGKEHSKKEKEMLTATQIIQLQNNLNASPIEQAKNPIANSTLPLTSTTTQRTKTIAKTLPKTGQKHTEAYLAIGSLSITLALATLYKKYN